VPEKRYIRLKVRRASALILGIVVALGLAACGGSNISQQDVSQAATQAAQEAKLKALKDQVQALQQQNGTSTPTGGSSDSSGRDCGSGVVALNAGTTCPFALNVAATYYDSGQPGTVEVFSPVTHQTYTMSCTAGHPHTCSGGNNAQVSVP
jgi:hypothetical protein